MATTFWRRATPCALSLLATCALAPVAHAQDAAARPVVFAPLPYDDDFSYLADPALRTTPWARLKYIPVGGQAYLTLGGEARLRTETREHLNFGRGVEDDGFDFQHRLRLWGDLNLTPNLRVYGEVQATGTNGDNVPTRNPVDHNDIEGHQLFVEYAGDYGDDGRFFVRGGRQEIALGKGRLMDPRNGPNTRRAYDALRFQTTRGDWRLGLIGGQTVRDLNGAWANESNSDFNFLTAHAARKMDGALGQGEIEFVYIHTDQEAARVSDFIGERDTYSLRVAAKKGALTYDVEAMLQDGETAAGQDVEAWFVGFEGGYQLPGAWKPRIGARVDAGSGDDDASDDKAQGFDALWGRGQSFTTEFGYTNMVQAGLNLNLNPIPQLNANLGVTALRRLSRDDGVYSLAPALIRGADEGRSRDVGLRTTARVDYDWNSHLSTGFMVNHVSAGDFLKETGDGKDLFYTSVFLTARF